MQISSVSSQAPLYWASPLARQATSGPTPSSNSEESQTWLWSAASKVTGSSEGSSAPPQTGSKVLMRALISMLEATLGSGGAAGQSSGALGSEYASAFAVVNAQGAHPMNAYLQQAWTRRMKGALQRIASDLQPGASISPELEQADVQALVTGLGEAGPGQSDEAAFIRSLLTGLSDTVSGEESPAPGSIISLQA